MHDPETELKCTVGDLMDFMCLTQSVDRWILAKEILERNGLRPTIEVSGD
jgi:hypothetical protein